MPRTASVIITPAEHKAHIATLKNEIKAVLANIKESEKYDKQLAKERAVEDAVFAKELKAIAKDRAAEDKQDAKDRLALDNSLALLQAKLSAATSQPFPTPAAAPTEDRPKRTRRTKAQMEEARAATAAAV